MSTEQNKMTVRRLMEALDRRDLNGVITDYAPDCKFHGFAPLTLDVAGYKQMMSVLLAAFPNSHFSIDDIIAEGNLVAARHSMQGTHQAEFQGIPPTGKQVTVPAIAIFRLIGGKVTEVWLNADFLGLLQQLRVVPMPT